MKYKQCANIVTRKVAGEVLLVPVKGNLADMQQLFTLNETGELVWECLREGTTAEIIVQRITETFDVATATAQADVKELLDRLLGKGLIGQVV